MRLIDLYHEAVERLLKAGIENEQVEVAFLFEHCFGLSRSQFILASKQNADNRKLQYFYDLLERRCLREPLQYITGTREFWSHDFLVTPGVLIPRNETEFLIQHVLDTFQAQKHTELSVLDMCTGSGVIALVLAKELAPQSLIAVDKSLEALMIAHKNRKKHQLETIVELICADLFESFKGATIFDLIVANPPYIADPDIGQLAPEVKDWEPGLALSGGMDGLDIIRKIAKKAPGFLKDNGWLFMEIGADQGDEVLTIFNKKQDGSPLYKQVKIIPDWAGRTRVLQAQVNK